MRANSIRLLAATAQVFGKFFSTKRQVQSICRVESKTTPHVRQFERLLLPLCSISIVLALLLFCVQPPPVHASGITVNALADDNIVNGNCTLREAITAANTNTIVDGCDAGTLGMDTINFSVNGTIVLSSTLGSLIITDTLIINGPGTSLLTISGNNATRVITVGSGITLNVSSVTIANGNASGDSGGGIYNNGGTINMTDTTIYSNTATFGGGIYNNLGLVTLNNTTLSSNSAGSYGGGGGIWNVGTLSITNSTLSGNNASDLNSTGGGIYNGSSSMVTISSSIISGNKNWAIYNYGTLTILNDTIDGNSGYLGGGIIMRAGGATISNSTFTRNVSTSTGGGVYNDGTVTVTNSTFVDNIAGSAGGAIYNNGALNIAGSTIFRNTASFPGGGGLFNNVSATLRNTIVANNTGSAGTNCYGTITNGGNNIDSGATCGWASSSGSMSNANPLFAPLGNYGGSTQTMGLLPGSPAYDTANPTYCTSTDQRGFSRFGNCDIGAFELQPIEFSTKSVDPSTALAGASLNYTITLNNPGADSLVNVNVTDTLPITITYSNGSLIASGGSYGYAGGVITWTGTLNATTSVNITFGATVNLNAPTGSITNSVVVGGGGEVFTRTASVLIPTPTPLTLFLPFVAKQPTPIPTLTPTPTPVPGGYSTIVSADFEGTFPSPWVTFDNNGGSFGEYYWGKRNCRPYTGSYSGWAVGGGANGSGLGCGSNYPDNAEAWMVYGPFSLASATAADLKYKLWLNSEPTYDGVCRLASIDGTNFYGLCTTGNSSGWIDRVLDFTSVPTLGNVTGQPNVWVAIIFASDADTNFAEGAYVDEVALRKCATGCAGLRPALVPTNARISDTPTKKIRLRR